jgi:hypothetical protein
MDIYSFIIIHKQGPNSEVGTAYKEVDPLFYKLWTLEGVKMCVISNLCQQLRHIFAFNIQGAYKTRYWYS